MCVTGSSSRFARRTRRLLRRLRELRLLRELFSSDVDSADSLSICVRSRTRSSPDVSLSDSQSEALGREKAELEVKLTNTVDNYEQQLALQHKTLTGSQREEMAVSSFIVCVLCWRGGFPPTGEFSENLYCLIGTSWAVLLLHFLDLKEPGACRGGTSSFILVTLPLHRA